MVPITPQRTLICPKPSSLWDSPVPQRASSSPLYPRPRFHPPHPLGRDSSTLPRRADRNHRAEAQSGTPRKCGLARKGARGSTSGRQDGGGGGESGWEPGPGHAAPGEDSGETQPPLTAEGEPGAGLAVLAAGGWWCLWGDMRPAAALGYRVDVWCVPHSLERPGLSRV